MSSLNWGLAIFLGIISLSCVTTHRKPCTEGGQSSRDPASKPFKGIKRCFQVQDESGAFVNDGKYYEWFNNDKISLEGEYKMGKKVGRWVEYNEKGVKISDKYYSDGKEVPPP